MSRETGSDREGIEDRVNRALLQESTVYLYTRGRRTGHIHKVPLYFTYNVGKFYLLAHVYANGTTTDWYLNLEADPNCILDVGRVRFSGRAIKVPEEGIEDDQVREMFKAKYGKEVYARWYAGTVRMTIAIPVLQLLEHEGVGTKPPSSNSWPGDQKGDPSHRYSGGV